MTKPDYDLLVSWVKDDVVEKIGDTVANAVHARLEHWFNETRDALMKRAAEIARTHDCRRHSGASDCSCSEEIFRDLTEARLGA